jgi:hypothetical protein
MELKYVRCKKDFPYVESQSINIHVLNQTSFITVKAKFVPALNKPYRGVHLHVLFAEWEVHLSVLFGEWEVHFSVVFGEW